jgi:hypothetical protein
MPASNIVSASGASDTLIASLPCGHVKQPFSSRLAKIHDPVPSQ